jgi:hypothetical protein
VLDARDVLRAPCPGLVPRRFTLVSTVALARIARCPGLAPGWCFTLGPRSTNVNHPGASPGHRATRTTRLYIAGQQRQQCETFIPLDHDPGQRLEADFGYIYVASPEGRRQVPVCSPGRTRTVRLPLPSERTEAILHGMVEGFTFFGCVPRVDPVDELRRCQHRKSEGVLPLEVPVLAGMENAVEVHRNRRRGLLTVECISPGFSFHPHSRNVPSP